MTAYDNPIYIADAALYLMNTQPDLGIKNPYALDQDQLDAAVDVLKDQNKHIGEYWTDYTKESQAFKTGSSVLGTTWEYTASISGPKPRRDGVPRQRLDRLVGHLDDRVRHRPRELRVQVAATGWRPRRPRQRSPSTSARRRPTRRRATSRPRDSATSTTPTDAAYTDKIWYWTTPIAQCLDGRTDVECTDYKDWTDAWTEVKG